MEKKGKRGWLMALFVIVGKSAKFAKLYKLMKLMKFTKLLLTFCTMALSAFVYSIQLGPWFAIGFVLMLFVHEMGYVVAMHKKGYKTSPPIFIPMLGAVIFAPAFKSAEDEAYIGIGGPLLGGLAALATFLLWLILPGKHELLLMVSFTATYLNLFNLIPIRPLDGGRVTHVVGTWFKWVGVSLLLAFSVYIRQPSILLIWILVLSDLSIDRVMKFWAMLACGVSMTLLMIFGYSDQKLWIDCLDILLSVLFVWMSYMQAFKMKGDKEEEKEVIAPRAVRWKWFGYYVLLTVALVVLIFIQAAYLPAQIRN